MKRTVVLAMVLARGLAAQTAPAKLAVHGLEPGISQTELRGRVTKLGGHLSCRPSVADARLAECSASLSRSPDHRLWSLRASLVNDVAAIVIVGASMPAADLDQLKDRWTDTLGRPNLRQEPGVNSFEWRATNRTLRLSAHPAGADRDVSISVVDRTALNALAKAP